MFFHISALTVTQPYVNETFAICQYFHKYHKQFSQIMALIHEGTSAGAWLWFHTGVSLKPVTLRRICDSVHV